MNEDARRTTPETLADPTAALPEDPVILQQMVLELLDALRETRRQARTTSCNTVSTSSYSDSTAHAPRASTPISIPPRPSSRIISKSPSRRIAI
jgi:hypothetical protein